MASVNFAHIIVCVCRDESVLQIARYRCQRTNGWTEVKNGLPISSATTFCVKAAAISEL
jgi:hypothetical protein